MKNEPVFFLVRYEASGALESWVGGLYPTLELAEERIAALKETEYYEYVWYDEITLGDCELCNR